MRSPRSGHVSKVDSTKFTPEVIEIAVLFTAVNLYVN